MPRRVAVSNLNARTIDILNTIRANASYEYQSQVPKVEQSQDIPKVGEVLFGYPALANQFLNALINRIALVAVRSRLFNNPYAELKKGYLEFGETIEEVFVQIAKAREFSAEKAPARELARSLPDVRSAFHTMNIRRQYPVTIQDMDLYQAFQSMDGVTGLISRIVDSLYSANNYDEFLLFKYLLIRGVVTGTIYPEYIGDGTQPKNAAVAFRSISNLITFMSSSYNASGVTTFTPREDQYIFMDARFNATFDVEVLAGAFNMDKADFMGRLFLIDDFTKFDSARFSEIQDNTTTMESLTPDDLTLMQDIVAIVVDREWFQFYDNQLKFTETYVASGEYWNYFLNVWQTVSYSPFSNAIAFVKGAAAPTVPASITVHVDSKSVGENATVLTLVPVLDGPDLIGGNLQFIQTGAATTAGVAIHRYGAVMFPPDSSASLTLELEVNGERYVAGTAITTAATTGTDIVFTKATASSVSVDAPVSPKAKATAK